MPTLWDVRICSETLEDVLCTPVHPGVRISSPGTICYYGCLGLWETRPRSCAPAAPGFDPASGRITPLFGPPR